MNILADLHVHIYDSFSVKILLKKSFDTLKSNNEKISVICLTETKDCDYYKELRNLNIKEYELFKLENCLVIKNSDLLLFIFQGFQINTSEKIEILSLLSSKRIASGLSLNETIKKINEVSGLAVINWAPGKWLGKRGEIIKDYILSTKEKFYIGDPSHRVIGIKKPNIYKLAKNKGAIILYGSDPLPFKGEDKEVFSYYSKYSLELSEILYTREALISLAISIQNKIRNEIPKPSGNRNFIFKFLYRQIRLRF